MKKLIGNNVIYVSNETVRREQGNNTFAAVKVALLNAVVFAVALFSAYAIVS